MSGNGKAEAADVVVLAQRGELKTLSDVVALLKTAWAKEGGIPAEVFHNNGIASINVAATALRSRGYEVEVFDDRGGLRMRLLATPGVGAKKRAKAQTSLFDSGAGSYKDVA